MAISRGVALFFLGTLLVSLSLIKATEADDFGVGVPIHAVRRDEKECDDQNPEKGDQCRDDHNPGVDDDVDDTFKVVNKMSVSLSASSGKVSVSATPFDATLDTEELSNHVLVLGH